MARIAHVLTAPVIYSLLLPFALLDLGVMLYQLICFPVYRVPRVRRADYLVIDRQHLSYLNLIEKINCVYCGYGNGVVGDTITERLNHDLAAQGDAVLVNLASIEYFKSVRPK